MLVDPSLTHSPKLSFHLCNSWPLHKSLGCCLLLFLSIMLRHTVVLHTFMEQLNSLFWRRQQLKHTADWCEILAC